jgi:hypothetical protein
MLAKGGSLSTSKLTLTVKGAYTINTRNVIIRVTADNNRAILLYLMDTQSPSGFLKGFPKKNYKSKKSSFKA